MEEMFKAITSPAWWGGVAIVGILINLASAYLKPWLDQAMSFVSLRWTARTEEQHRQRLRRIEHLRGDTHRQLLASIAGLHAGIWATIMFILSISGFFYIDVYMHIHGTSSLLPYTRLLFILGMFLAQKFLSDFVRIAVEIREARRSEDNHSQTNI
jgi:hypothetical protein